jgi:ribonuclease Z
MEITFLGTSSGVPTRSRNVSSVALRLPQRSEIWLFDCGEGTQHQFLRSELRSSQIRRIFITHMHGDHIFGLMGLLASCGLAGAVSEIDIYGPPELNDYLAAARRFSQTHLAFPVRVHAVKPGLVVDDGEFRVDCALLKHRVTAHGFRVTERDREGVFDVEKAQALGIPFGPLYGRLKQGERVVLEDGRSFDGKDFVGPMERGRSVVYCTDTVFCDRAVELAKGADVLIHEATYAHADAEMAIARQHSTSTMAAQTAYLAGVETLLMTHFSPRYAPGNGGLEWKDLLAEARSIFPNTLMAKDLWSFEVPRRRGEEKREEGRQKREEGRRKTEEGRQKREEGKKIGIVKKKKG